MLNVSAIPSSIGIHDESAPSTVPAQTFTTWVDRDDHESSSVSSDSCWGEMEDLNGKENVEWGLLLPGAPVAAQTPLDAVRANVPPEVLSALEQDLCEHDHGIRSPSATQVSTVQNSPVQEIGRSVRPHQESVPSVRLKNRFSPLVESPIVRDTMSSRQGCAEEEMPPSQSVRRRPTQRFRSMEATRIDPEGHPIDEDRFEKEADTESVHSFPQRRRRRLILNFAREQEEPVDSGTEGLELRERLNRVEESADIVLGGSSSSELDQVQEQMKRTQMIVKRNVSDSQRAEARKGEVKMSKNWQRGRKNNILMPMLNDWKITKAQYT